MDIKQFAIDNFRAQASEVLRAGNSIEWFKCNCGSESNLLWTYKSNKSRLLACSKDCAVKLATAQVKLGYLVNG